MGMLLRRYYENNKAAGATDKVAPKPTNTIEVQEAKPVKVEVVENKPEEKKVTRGDIMKMNVATVRAYAETQGIEGANAMSGAELKRILGDKLFEESE